MQNSNNPNFNDIGKQIVSSLASGLSTGNYSELKDAIKQTASDAIREATGFGAGSQSSNAGSEDIPHYSGDVVDESVREKVKGIYRASRDVTGSQEAYGTPGPQGYVNPHGTPAASQAYAKKLEEERKRREAQRQANVARQAAAQNQANSQLSRQNEAKKPTVKISNLPTKFVPVGKVSGILCIVLGSMGILGFSISCLVSGIEALFGGQIGKVIVFAVLALASGIALKIGINQRKTLNRAKRYVQICGQNMYTQISALASALGISVSKVKKDIKKILSKGFFPEGYIDEEETTLMLSSEIYKQYRNTKEHSINATAASVSDDLGGNKKGTGGKNIKREIQLSEKAIKAREKLSDSERKELDDMVKEGLDCIDKLHSLNDDIPDESISAKMDELESTLNDIFVRVEEHPDQMKRMHRLMDYYLPTMLKLVEAYKEYDEIPNPADNIVSAKAEIESTLDTINDAFKELLGRLFKDSVLDVTTDAQVLQTVLKEDGLTPDTRK